jgi:adenosylcobinamide kinase / adenosylcobinamide-phosphate guanylyltransferase
MAPRSEFILGGQRSGKSRRAELLARDWLAQSPNHKAVLIATATAWDDEMHQRITRHQQDRKERVPAMTTVEAPIALADAIQTNSTAQTIVVVDCLTLWLTNLLMPHADVKNTGECSKSASKLPFPQDVRAQAATLLIAIQSSVGPLVVVGNEIGLGVVPMGCETRAFVDALGRLNQDVAMGCERVTFMAAGLPLFLKGNA